MKKYYNNEERNKLMFDNNELGEDYRDYYENGEDSNELDNDVDEVYDNSSVIGITVKEATEAANAFSKAIASTGYELGENPTPEHIREILSGINEGMLNALKSLKGDLKK